MIESKSSSESPYTVTRLHGVTSHKTIPLLVIAMETSNVASPDMFLFFISVPSDKFQADVVV